MNFLAPAAFLFAAVLPVVVVFYLLKRKRVVRLVSSTVLWQRFLAETQASAPFQKLRKNWLLILQLLLLILAILALARPFFATDIRPAQLRVVILDGSASMQATDVKPSRFEVARAEALKWVDGLAAQDQMVVVLAGASTEVKQSATSDKAALRRALQACSSSDAPTRLAPALRMAESLVREQLDAEIHLFSDGGVAGLEEFDNRALPLIYHRVGKTAENVGITALDVRANPENPLERAVYANILNVSSNAQSIEAELRFNDRPVESRTILVPGGQAAPQVFLAKQSQDGVFSVRLTVSDDLAADNQASIVSLVPRPVKVLLVTRGNRLLERALRAAPNVQLTIAADVTEPSPAFDFVVLDTVTPGTWPQRNVLAIRVAAPKWFESVSELEAPAIVDWRSTHPLLRFSGFDNVQLVQSLAVPAPSWAVSLADAPQASLAVAGELDRQRIIWLGFDLLESNWPLRVSFPIFVANAIEWLNPASTSSAQLQVKGGEPFRLTLPQSQKSAQVTLPSGRQVELTLEQDSNELVIGDTARQGVYRVQAGTNDLFFCVNVLDPAETDIRPREEIQLGKFSKVAATTMRRANLELWRTIAAVALLLLLGEWWYYHRRTV